MKTTKNNHNSEQMKGLERIAKLVSSLPEQKQDSAIILMVTYADGLIAGAKVYEKQ